MNGLQIGHGQAPGELKDWRQVVQFMVSLLNFEEINDQAIARIRLEYDNYPDRIPYLNLPESNEEIIRIFSNNGVQNDNFEQDENQNDYLEQDDNLEQDNREDSIEEQKMEKNHEADKNATDDNYEQGLIVKGKIKQKKFGRPKVAKSRQFYIYKR
eukprot:403349540